MKNNLTNKERNVRGMYYTLGVSDPNKLYFTSDT